MIDLPLKTDARFDRVALTYIIGALVAPLAPATWYKPDHIETRLNLEPQ